MKICPRIVGKLILCTDFKCFITRSNGDTVIVRWPLFIYFIYKIDFVSLAGGWGVRGNIESWFAAYEV